MVDVAVLEQGVDLMILEVFSTLNNSVIQFCDSILWFEDCLISLNSLLQFFSSFQFCKYFGMDQLRAFGKKRVVKNFTKCTDVSVSEL